MSISFIYPSYLWLLLLLPLTVFLGVLGRRDWQSEYRSTRIRFWSGLALRCTLLLLIICALAGIQLRLRADNLTTVFLLDVSDSIPSEEIARGETFLRTAIEKMPDNGNQAAIILFGKEALVERLASEEHIFSDLTSVPVSTRTDIASALQLAQAIFPAEGSKRMVLLSDGRENLGQAIEQAGLAASQGMELLYVPLGKSQGETEVLVDVLEAPADVRQGENFELTAVINSSASINASLRIFVDGVLLQTIELHLQPGTNRISIPISAEQASSTQNSEGGFRRFQAQVIPEADTRLQNNEASAFTVVYGPPHVLLVEGAAGEADNLVNALQAAKMNVSRMKPAEIPTTLSELAGYEAVILFNVSASALPARAMEALPVYVRDLGFGLLMIGGQDAYGAGGYLRTPLEAALPVDMDVKDKEMQANLALVLAVDKSGSMGRCHCDNPDLNQTYTRAEVGQPKVDIAKEAIMRAASALGPQDYLGVVTFDNSAHWALRVSPLTDPNSLEQAIGTFGANGSTNLEAGVAAAYSSLENVSARRKHVILMTDGWVRQGDLTKLALEMSEKGITLSVVAAGEGSALYLTSLADMGGGRFYPATDIFNVPDIFLKETVKSVGQYIIEEPFYPLPSVPGPALSGLDTTRLPALLGYNGTTAKGTARLDLLTPRGDPLLATWQYGLGRSAAWTSDLKNQWAREWLSWPDFPRFSAQLVNWLLPAPKTEGLEASATAKDGMALINLLATGADGLPLNFLSAQATLVDPNLETINLELQQIGPGQYQVVTDAAQPGAYLVRLGINQDDQSLGQTTLGMIVPYSPEYKASGMDRGLLSELARLTGGGELSDPLEAFLHNLPAVDYAREIWRSLLLLAVWLFPLDIALRRVMFSKEDLRKARSWVAQHIPGPVATDSAQPRLLGQLFQARERARQRQSGNTELPASQTSEEQPAIPSEKNVSSAERPPAAGIKSPPPSSESATGDSLARLREAKKRARR